MLEDQNPDQNPEPSRAQGMKLQCLSQLQSFSMHYAPDAIDTPLLGA